MHRGRLLMFTTLAVLGTASVAEAAQAKCRVMDAGATYETLQEAVEAASARDTLEVTGTCLGDTAISKDLSIVGRGGATLDGTGTPSHVVYIGFLTPATVSITGVTITGGAPRIQHLGEEEDDEGDGGGIDNYGSLTLTRSTVVANTATAGNGGPGPLPESSVGGGILNGGKLVLDHSTVVGNTAEEGGGLYILGFETNSSTTLIDSTVAGNVGGGILQDYEGSLALDQSAVTRNTGVGIENRGVGSVTLRDSRVTHNTGVGILSEPGSTVTLIDSKVAHNGGE